MLLRKLGETKEEKQCPLYIAPELKAVSLRTGLKMLNFTNIEINNGYLWRSGFAERDGRLYYFSRNNNEDIIVCKGALLQREAQDGKYYGNYKLYYFSRDNGENVISCKGILMHREARDRKDYSGYNSINQWSLDAELAKKGARISEPFLSKKTCLRIAEKMKNDGIINIDEIAKTAKLLRL
jgi:hypothetical protein